MPEFTFGNMRIDATIIDTSKRDIKGLEIKVNRRDFLQDRKWTFYSKFCTTLSIICPEVRKAKRASAPGQATERKQ